VLTFVNKFYSIKEDNLPQVRMAIINLAVDVLDKYYSTNQGEE
jgi:hypothetical protein